jgi:DNA-directed RNA polymerase specialized sigma24 family protein
VAQMTPSSSTTPTMREESDADLLYYMSCRENPADRAVSDAGTLEFHRRYAVGLLDRCRSVCRQFGSVVDAEDLFAVTLVKAIERAETFVTAVDAASHPARTLNWLARIARNLHVDALRNPNRSGPLTGEQEAVPVEDYSTEEFAALYCDGHALPRDLATIGMVQAALLTLDERTRRIIAYTVLQRQRSPKRNYVYRGAMKALANELGTTTVNLRRIRLLGVAAISEYVRTHTGQV